MSSTVYTIIGGRGGIGKVVTEKLREDGATVATIDRSPSDDQFHFQADASNQGSLERAVAAIEDKFGPLRGVANLAGSILIKPAHSTTQDEFESVISQNLHTAFNTVKTCAPRIAKHGGGSVVLVSSAAARIGLKNHDAIAAAKAGVEGLARSASATYARRGVRVNCVGPGLVDTPMAAPILASEANRKYSEGLHAVGKIGAAEDVAQAICLLLSESTGGWITGQVFAVDGGLSRVRS